MNILRSIAVFAAAAMAFACGQPAVTNNTQKATNSTPAPTASVSPAAADLAAAGRKLYADNCAGCHKEDGKGGKITIEGKSINPDDLTADKIKRMTDDKLYGYVYNGIADEGMPAFKDDLSEAEIREVVRYVRSEIQKMPLAAPTPRAGGVD